MKRNDWIVVLTLALIAFFINRGRTFPSQIARAEAARQAAMAVANRAPEDPFIGFTAEAKQAIPQEYSIKCLAAHDSRRKFSGYGVETEMVVISARFQVSKGSWSKNYDISTTIDASQYQGLTDADTIARVVKELSDEMQADTSKLSTQ
jgi:hypothetical protein